MFPPERIVCLTGETVETLYLLGENRRIAGVSGYGRDALAGIIAAWVASRTPKALE